MLVRIKKDDLNAAGIPFEESTLYTWHCNGKYPELFVKIGRRVFISKEKWDKFEKKLIKESEKKANQVNKFQDESYKISRTSAKISAKI